MSDRGVFVLDVIGDEERLILDRWKQRFPTLRRELVGSKKGHAILRMA
jgi:hypothetical protein